MISRRGSQSDEETSSLINQSMSEEERLKEFSFVQEDEQVDHGKRSSAAKRTDAVNKNDCHLKTYNIFILNSGLFVNTASLQQTNLNFINKQSAFKC